MKTPYGGSASVFISYSRKDREKASRISDVLRERAFAVFRDTEDIMPTEEWRGRLEQLIREADTIVFLLSPHSANSEVCAWEVDLAASLNKRIAPVVIEEVEDNAVPLLLARLNFILCTEPERFELAIDSLVSTLLTDIDWIREHTRLAGLAQRWDRAGRPAHLLLRGQDILDAERWRDMRPAKAPDVTAEHSAFVSQSRHGASRRQRYWIVGSLSVSVATAALAVFAYFQSIEAERQRDVAETERIRAEEQRTLAEEQQEVAEQRLREVLLERLQRTLADGETSFAEGRVEAAARSALEALDAVEEIGDQALLERSERLARRVLVDSRSRGYLEGNIADLLDPNMSKSRLTETAIWLQEELTVLQDLLRRAYLEVSDAAVGEGALALTRERLRLWSLRSGDTSFTLDGITAAGFRRDGMAAVLQTRLSVGPTSQPGAFFMVLNPASPGEVITEKRYDLLLYDGWILEAAGLALAYGSRDDTAMIFALDLEDGAALFSLPVADRPTAVAAADDEMEIAFVDATRKRISRVDGEGRVTDTLESAVAVNGLRYLRGGRILAFESGDGWTLWAPGTEPQAIMVGGGRAEEIIPLESGSILARGDTTAAVIDTRNPLQSKPIQDTTVFWLVGENPAEGTVILRGNGSFSVHDVATGNFKRGLENSTGPTRAWSLSADGAYLAAGSIQGISVMSTSTGRELLSVRPKNGVNSLWLMDQPSGPLLVALNGLGQMQAWQVEPYALVLPTSDAKRSSSFWEQAPRGKELTVSANSFDGRELQFWDLASGDLMRTEPGLQLVDTDQLTGRHLVREEDFTHAILLPGGGKVALEGLGDLNAWNVTWSDRQVALHRPGVIEVYETDTGRRNVQLALGGDEDGHAIAGMSFYGPKQALVALSRTGTLRIIDPETGSVTIERRIAGRATELYASPVHASMLIADGQHVWHYDGVADRLTQLREEEAALRVAAAGTHAAILVPSEPGDDADWMIDLETGVRRFTLPTGGGYALGDADRILASELWNGAVRLYDAQTGALLAAVTGDGGHALAGHKPLISSDEAWVLATNAASHMLRLISTETGEVRSSVARRPGSPRVVSTSRDLSSATFRFSLGEKHLPIGPDVRIGAVRFTEAMASGTALIDTFRRQFPGTPEVRDHDDATDCDRLAAFENDPQARANGVPFKALVAEEPLNACNAALQSGDTSAQTLFQAARVWSSFAQSSGNAQSSDIVGVFRELADQGYGAAAHSLAFMMIERSIPGTIDEVVRYARAASAAGVGASTLLLVRFAERGLIPDDPDALIEEAMMAGQPLIIARQARERAGEGAYAEAARLASLAAELYGKRHQRDRAESARARSVTYAVRAGVVGP